MEPSMKKKSIETALAKRDLALAELETQMSVENRQADFNRIRSFTIGTAFGGTTEINVRANSGACYWGLFQPVEVIELIHQLAANVGCHIHIQPRRDFAAWRDWKYTEEELAFAAGRQPHVATGHAPYTKGWHENQQVAATLPHPEQQPGLNIERKQNEPVATKKTVNRRSTKRAATTA
jgi:hypothetical protein